MLEGMTAISMTVVYRALEPLRLPWFKGSAFRGALGHALRQVSCALRRQQCAECLLRQRCAYSVCFESPVPDGAAIMRKYPYAPHPFVLDPPAAGEQSFDAGDELALGIVLVGRAADHLPHFLYAFHEMGEGGFGRDRGKAKVLRVESGPPGARRVIYDGAAQRLEGDPWKMDADGIGRRCDALRGHALRLVFETPARFKSQGKLSRHADLGLIMPGLLRRLTSLHYFFCGGPEHHDVRPLLEAARQVNMRASDTTWTDWTRYSSRQDTTMQMGGITGWACYDPVPDALLPVLCWGELLHLGKGCSLGLGKYRIEPQENPAVA